MTTCKRVIRIIPPCSCKNGVTGSVCDQCVDGFYNFTSLGCAACECNSMGGNGVSCDESGQCQCKVSVHVCECVCVCAVHVCVCVCSAFMCVYVRVSVCTCVCM